MRSRFLIGPLKTGPSEDAFEALVKRSERLAQKPFVDEETPFEGLIARAVERLPDEFQRLLSRVAIVVSTEGVEARAYGLYWGDTVARDDAPDRIVIFQDTLERDFGHDPELLARQVEITLRHELGHHLGWDEPGVGALGL